MDGGAVDREGTGDFALAEQATREQELLGAALGRAADQPPHFGLSPPALNCCLLQDTGAESQ